MGEPAAPSGPDLADDGVDDHAVTEQTPVLGHVGDDAILLVREHGRVHAIGATCSHYGGPLAEGIVVDGTIRCPWHHACFDLATGDAHGPAIAPIACYDVALVDGKLRVGAKRAHAHAVAHGKLPASVAIVGGGAAGVACIEALREGGYKGAIALATAEGTDPVDRPNLSKDYLAGTAQEEWVFLRTADALRELAVTVVGRATAIDRAARTIAIEGGAPVAYGALVIATGAEPVRLPIEGADLPHVHVLRTLADSRAIAASEGPVVVIGASFIGLEVAASLRARGRAVTVVGPESVPLARVLGERVGAFVREIHEAKGVEFRLGTKPVKITADRVILDDGTELPARAVVTGVGVRPRGELAAAAGLTMERGGIVVDDELRAAPDIYAAGDVAVVPWSGGRARIEHWQVAVRHGQAVARAILGTSRSRRRDVPFFWSQHHDVTLGYVGHAEKFGEPEVHGDLAARDAHVVYREGGAVAAVVTIGRDKVALEVEALMETGDRDGLSALVAR